MSASPATRVDLYYRSRFSAPPGGVVFAPGRLVLLGEHVDHQGGPVLAVALEQGVHVAFGVRPDRRVSLHALNARATDTFEGGATARSGRRWADLVRGAFAHLAEGGRRLPGLNLVAYGDLPAKQGLASSAAYLTAVLRAVVRATGGTEDVPTLAQAVAAIERTWGGVACGTMDPYVALVGLPGAVVHLDNRRLTHEVLPLPPGTTLVPVSTGLERRLDQTPYNERLSELARALDLLRRAHPELGALVDLPVARFEAWADGVPEPPRRRARYVVTECDRVRRAAGALARGDAEALGRLMDEGHASLARDFECSTPAIDAQVAMLRGAEGVLGVRLQGAGWGGSIAVLRRGA